jgi:hypothetical protein
MPSLSPALPAPAFASKDEPIKESEVCVDTYKIRKDGKSAYLVKAEPTVETEVCLDN